METWISAVAGSTTWSLKSAPVQPVACELIVKFSWVSSESLKTFISNCPVVFPAGIITKLGTSTIPAGKAENHTIVSDSTDSESAMFAVLVAPSIKFPGFVSAMLPPDGEPTVIWTMAVSSNSPSDTESALGTPWGRATLIYNAEINQATHAELYQTVDLYEGQ